MKKEKAMELIADLPDLTPEIEKECRYKLHHYLTFTKYEAYCSACENYVNIEKMGTIKHRKETTCPLCGNTVTAIDVTNSFCGNVIENRINAVAFLSSEKNENLYIRCFTLCLFFCHNKLEPKITWREVQAYVFTPKSAVRYGHDYNWKLYDGQKWYTKEYNPEWTPRTKFTEPVFQNYNNVYAVNSDAINKTFMNKIGINEYCEKYPNGFFNYYQFYRKNPGIERLAKSGLTKVAKDCITYNCDIDFSQNEPHKMMGVTKDVMRAIRKEYIELGDYRYFHEKFPSLNLKTIVELSSFVGYNRGSLDFVIKMTGLTVNKLISYMKKQKIKIYDYHDYLSFAQRLGIDVKDKSVIMPPNLKSAHDRLYAIENAMRAEKEAKKETERNEKLEKLFKQREKLEFRCGEYLIRQPTSAKEIINEGQALSHCVGGYADRHVDGKLTIMFLRKKSEPDKPYYTIEVNNDYKIVQCRGYKNNWVQNGGEEKPQEIVELEREYQKYLNNLIKKEKKTA